MWTDGLKYEGGGNESVNGRKLRETDISHCPESKRKWKRKLPLEKAMLTVEASLSLPVFLFALIALLYFLQIIFIQEMLGQAMARVVEESSEYAFVYDRVLNDPEENKKGEKLEKKPSDGKEKADAVNLTKKLMGDVYFQQAVKKYVDSEFLDASCINGGFWGISFLGSSFMEEEDKICIKASYGIRLPIPDFLSRKLFFAQKIESRGFVGSQILDDALGESGGEEKEAEDETTVYITETGSCYHMDENCSSIRLKIEPVSALEVEKRRNNGGGKYYLCERCGASKAGGCVYIAKEGDRYHSSLSCPGLKRTVTAVKRSEAEKMGKRCCKRCGG